MYLFELRARRTRLEQLLGLTRYLRREIRCEAVPLPILLTGFQENLPLLRLMDCNEPFDLVASYEEAKSLCRDVMLLDEDSWRALDALFFSLGRGDGAAQEEALSACEAYLRGAVEAAKEKILRNGKPALVLGCSFGAILVLIFL